MKKIIHCIGDSHSAVFSGEDKMQPEWPRVASNTLPYFKSYRIGPATAYQLNNKIPIISDIINQNVKQEPVLFCFGEVDCRAHLKKQIDLQNKTVNEIVNECVDRYFETILYFKNQGVDIIIWGPIASWHDSKPYTGGPSFGTNFERNEITKQFNRYLESLCDMHNVQFITLFYDMIDENGITKPEYLDNWVGSHIHLSQYSMPDIISKFQTKKLI